MENVLENIENLIVKYQINETSDPNFFEKLFSSVSKTRMINFVDMRKMMIIITVKKME